MAENQTILQEIEENKKMNQKPVGSNASGLGNLTDQQKSGVVSWINSRKNDYFSSWQFHWYRKRVQNTQYLINQELPPSEKNTRMGLVKSIMRRNYDFYYQSLVDIFDVEELIVVEPGYGSPQEKKFAEDMQVYINRLLYAIDYQSHLYERFLYLPDYGWSISFDTYRPNNGYEYKAKAETRIPGMDALEFTAEEDNLLSKPDPRIIRPLDWFGSPFHNQRHQTGQGFLDRWYISDFRAALAVKDANGNSVYDDSALKKWIEKLSKGDRHADPYKSSVDSNTYGRGTYDAEQERTNQGYADIIKYFGTLENVPGFENDTNEYYVEMTQSEILRFQENPKDGSTTLTHMQSHPLRDMPFSRTWLDSTIDHQKFEDIITNVTLENAIDSSHRIWGYWEEDLVNYEELQNPEGLQTFLQLQGNGRGPQLFNDGRSGSLQDLSQIMQNINRDAQAATTTQQDQGLQGGQSGKTATQSRLAASGQMLKTRAPIKLFVNQAIIPQVKNLVMMSLVQGNPLRQSLFSKDGRPVQITPDHIQWYMANAKLRVSDKVTRDWFDISQRMQGFLQMAQQTLPQISNPENMVEAMRWAGKFGDVPDYAIDAILPEPIKADDPEGQIAQENEALKEQLAQSQEQMAQMQQQLQQLAQAADKNQTDQAKLEIEGYRAQTDRMETVDNIQENRNAQMANQMVATRQNRTGI